MRDIKAALVSFDDRWAEFERSYIFELIHIEEQARSIIVEAIDKERRLTNFECDFGEARDGGGRGELGPPPAVSSQRRLLGHVWPGVARSPAAVDATSIHVPSINFPNFRNLGGQP